LYEETASQYVVYKTVKEIEILLYRKHHSEDEDKDCKAHSDRLDAGP
jgi:hypothetical protein